LIKRHRLVNQAAAELLRHEIHALSIKAQTIAEYESGLN
jgi:stress-induced morphogen